MATMRDQTNPSPEPRAVPIEYIVGDVTEPKRVPGYSGDVIAHVCNDVCRFGAGVADAIGRRFPPVKVEFLRWAKQGAANQRNPYGLGAVQVVRADMHRPLWVANMVAQRGLRCKENRHPLSLDHLAECLWKLRGLAAADTVVHMPPIGCGRGGANWGEVEPLVSRYLSQGGIPVYVYDLPK